MIKNTLKKSERGQAIILIAAALVGLVAIVGLMTDGGMLLIEYARLKRGIDAASVAAAQQFRKDFTGSDLANAAENFLRLNQSDVIDVVISICDPDGDFGGTPQHDPSLCPTVAGQPRRKLVRVTATREITFGFLRVININSTRITATSVGEAASIDLVLIIDTSLSMAYRTSGQALVLDGVGTVPYPADDVEVCNATQTCQPLEDVKTVAKNFIGTLFFPYDRVGIVTMTQQGANGSRSPTLMRFPITASAATTPLSDNYNDVFNALSNVSVFQPPRCVRSATPGVWVSPPKGTCLEYDVNTGNFVGANAPRFLGGPDLNETNGTDYDFTSIPSSNVGGTFLQANAAFVEAATTREDAFWVIIALMSGPANATDGDAAHPDGYCPSNTWNVPGSPRCRDSDLPTITRHPSSSPNYDADDYARDMADFVANPIDGNGITIFTIGLSPAVQQATSGLPASGENLLRYIAEDAGNITDGLGNVTREANHGQYYYAADPAIDLGPIFLAIAENIFTRITQ